MSIADHFDPAPDAGFVRVYDAPAARRQFQVSLALIVILAMAALTLGLSLRFDELGGQIGPVPSTHESHAAVASAMDEILLRRTIG